VRSRHFPTSDPECAAPSHLRYLLRTAQREHSTWVHPLSQDDAMQCQSHGCAQGAKCLPHQSLWPYHFLGAVALPVHRNYSEYFHMVLNVVQPPASGQSHAARLDLCGSPPIACRVWRRPTRGAIVKLTNSRTSCQASIFESRPIPATGAAVN
jgi:hypothetical protein